MNKRRSAIYTVLGVVTAIVVAVLVAVWVWWIRYRKLPTLRVTYTIGKGSEVGLDWIEFKRDG